MFVHTYALLVKHVLWSDLSLLRRITPQIESSQASRAATVTCRVESVFFCTFPHRGQVDDSILSAPRTRGEYWQRGGAVSYTHLTLPTKA